MIAQLLVGTAAAECGLDAAGVEDAARRSEAAIHDDDAEAHTRALAEILVRLPCLSEPVPAGPWARLLLDEALVRLAAGERHQELVAAALRADPDLQVPGFLVEGWVPQTALPTGPGALRYEATWVDGVPIEHPVALGAGIHLVQARRPQGWLGFVVQDGAFPPPLLGAPPEEARPTASRRVWLAAEVGGGLLGWEQRPVGERARSGPGAPAVDLALFGWGSLGRPLGLAASLSVLVGGGDLLPTGFGGLAVGGAGAGLWLGGGTVAVPVEDDRPRTVPLPVPAAGLRFASGGVDGGVTAAGWPGAWHLEGRAGVGVMPIEPRLALRIGGEVSATAARFVETPGDERVRVSGWRATVRFGVGTRSE